MTLALSRSTIRPLTAAVRPRARTIALLLASLFALLTLDGLLHERAVFDASLLRAVQGIEHPLLEPVIRPVDMLTSSTGAIGAWVLMLAGLLLLRWWIPAGAALVLPAGGVINEMIGEHVVGRARPNALEFERAITQVRASSFPSGHVLGAVLLYGLLLVISGRIANRPLRLAVRAGCVAMIFISGFGRVWYGAHYPTDVLGAYALGGLLLVCIAAVYRRADAAWGRLPLVRAAVPVHDESRPHAHALTSLVEFDAVTVTKVYAPGLLPRLLYWLAFQAEFPYLRNRTALEAARHRRNLAALLTRFWYGDERVARVVAIERRGDGYGVVSERIHGHAPQDRAVARAWLRGLRDRFEQAGLPTWQIDPRQPRAVDNVLETADGRYLIVDLESGLVAPVASWRTWRRALRRGAAPMFDDVFFDITYAYVAANDEALRTALGPAAHAELLETLTLAEQAQTGWQRGEPRLWGRLLRAAGVAVAVRSWRARLAGGRERAQAWLAQTVDVWQFEGRVSPAEAAGMRAQMATPEFQAVLPHLGAHLAISIVLRFPFGSIARAGWTMGALTVATARLLVRRCDRRAWLGALRLHSPAVMLIGAVPGFGGFAYLAARPVRANRLLLRATVDATMQKAPWRLYERSGLRRWIARRPAAAPSAIAYPPSEGASSAMTVPGTAAAPHPGV